jgi:F-type H+-transporting ATPase subunit b
MLAQTKDQCARLLEQAKTQIAAEKEQALAQVRGEISRLSVLAASRLIGEEMDQTHADKVVAGVLEQIKKK